MSDEIQVVEKQALTVGDIKSHVNRIQEVLKNVMIENTHYGKIPGCGNKPALLKAGAEKILATFMLASEFVIDDLSTEDNKFYRVHARLSHQSTKTFMGSGIGECSSLESKYAWRAAVCDEEFEATAENLRRVHFKPGYNGAPVKKVNQVRQDMHSLSNTILKMSKKRALIDAVMNVTACSDIFVQDLDEAHLKEAAGVPDVPKTTPPAQTMTKESVISAFNLAKDKAGLAEKWKLVSTNELSKDKDIVKAYQVKDKELSK